MKCSRLVASVLLAFSLIMTTARLATPVHGAEAAAKAPSLPPEVRAQLPQGAVSLRLAELPIGPQASALLVHLWAVPRLNKNQGYGGYSQWLPSPLCVDVFAPGDKAGSWRFITATAYTGKDEPRGIRTHWLRPKQKEGAILEIVSSSGAPGVSTRHTLLIFPHGVEGSREAHVQDFWSGGLGGGRIDLDFSGMDASGTMTVTTTDSFQNKVNSKVVSKWNGDGFAAPPAK